MANIENNIKKGQYLKKTGPDSYVHYHLDTDDSVVYLSEKIDGADGSGAAYAKGTTLHETLCALYTLASKGGQASTDLANLTNKVNTHIQNVSNPHNVTKTQVGLGSVVNAPMDNTPKENSNNYVKSGGVYTAVKNVSDKADQAISIANGQSHAYVFADVTGLRSGTLSNKQPIQSGYKVGDSIYIIATTVSDFWISGSASTGTASNANAINSAKKGDTIVVKWGSAYVSLTAFESKRDLSDYVTTGALNTKLNDYYDKTTSDNKYVPYSGATKNVTLGNHTLTVGDDTVQVNQISTKIAGGNITLNGLANLPAGSSSTTVGRKVEIDVNGITVDENKKYNYPLNSAGTYTLATQEYVTGKGYQTSDEVNALINQTSLTFGGDVSGTGVINEPDIELNLNNQKDLPDDDKYRTFSAVHVNKKGIVTSGAQQIRFASTIDDPILNDLVIGGVAIIDAK